VDPSDTTPAAGSPAPALLAAAPGTAGLADIAADLSAIIVRQEREKQELLDDLRKATVRAECAEAERNNLGLSLLTAADLLGQQANMPPEVARGIERIAVSLRAAAAQARREGKREGILAGTLETAARLINERLDRFEGEKPGLADLIPALRADLRTIAANMERALRRAEQAGRGEEGDAPAPAKPAAPTCQHLTIYGQCRNPATVTVVGPAIEYYSCAACLADRAPLPAYMRAVPIEGAGR
jgi:hypothetical protein